MIRFENVSKKYGQNLNVVNDLTLHVRKGELLVLIGPSGCGKTTTMKMINRLVEPSSGKIFVNNEDISTLNPVELRRNIGYVIQNIGLLPHMTIAENVALVPKLKKWDKERYLQRVDELLQMVNLDPAIFASRYPGELSGGQQQRIGVIRAMAADPPIILMDEPCSALDPIATLKIEDLMQELALNYTIIIVTHNMQQAARVSDYTAFFMVDDQRTGHLLEYGVTNQIFTNPKNRKTEEYITGRFG